VVANNSDWLTVGTMAKKVERVRIKDLDNTFVSRPRSDQHRYEHKMNLDTVSDADRLELEQTLLANTNYRVHVCTLPFEAILHTETSRQAMVVVN
jgi:hypothetical protein